MITATPENGVQFRPELKQTQICVFSRFLGRKSRFFVKAESPSTQGVWKSVRFYQHMDYFR